jgi:alpha-amylase
MSTAIHDIMVASDEPVNVYTLSGQLIRRGANMQEAMQGLSRGIFIIGGKKVVIR